jgi:simple sugar transport system substrate-binding protein
MKRMKKAVSIILAAAVMAIFAQSVFAAGAKDAGTAPAADAYRFTMVIYGTTGNPFWKKVVAGATDTASTLGIKLDIQYAEDQAEKQVNILETAIGNKIDGIGLIINYDDAYDKVVQKARDAGIPVVAYNIDDTMGAAGNKRMAFVGQDFVTAGYLISKRLIETYGIKKGDLVVCPVEHPAAVYAAKRYEGVKKALDEVGAVSEVLDTGAISLEDTLTKLTQYMVGHKNTKAVLAMGGMPMEVAPQAIKEAGLNIPNAGFDITKKIITNILEGKSLATVDQQPYYQGSFTVMQLYLNKKYGLLPCDINTGGAIIDKSNAAKVLELADTVR